MDGIVVGSDGRPRCAWCVGDPLYERYHDAEWGRPTADDRRLFEKLCLEGFQAGLSWLTILRKRGRLRAAFADFEPRVVARFGDADVERLMTDAGIVRNRAKISATINNATRYPALVEEFGGLAEFMWRFEPGVPDRPPVLDHATLTAMPLTAESKRLSRELRRRGWAFVGPTTVYSAMQAVGIVNDHLEGCFARAEVERDRNLFTRPDR